ncbi:MAG: hypothetical protein U5L45_18695 [Saprospiraceae bacterium]|nr:hypothetical protein [Saprospiraceae bacterium]
MVRFSDFARKTNHLSSLFASEASKKSLTQIHNAGHGVKSIRPTLFFE